MPFQAAKATASTRRRPGAPSVISGILLASAIAALASASFAVAATSTDPPHRVAVRWRAEAGSPKGAGALTELEAATERVRGLVDAGIVTAVTPLLRGEDERAKGSGPDLGTITLLQLSGRRPTAEIAASLTARPDVLYAVPLRSHFLWATPDDIQPAQTAVFDQIALTQAWELTRGELGTVVVAVVDGGFDLEHPDLAPNVWVNPGEIAGNGQDDDRNGHVDDIHGWSFSENGADLRGNPSTPENTRHGTHVAGIIGAATNNGSGMAGAAWNVRILPVRVAHPQIERRIDYGYEGIVYAVENGAQIVNLSWGGPAIPSPFERDVIEWAWAKGAVLVAAAGNTEDDSVTLPGAYPRVLSVASLDAAGLVSNFSTRGWWVDLAAPGEQVLGPTAGGGYELRSGTSFATPLVSSICALVQTRWPDANPDAVRERVRMSGRSVEDLQLPWNRGQLGRGRVDALRALTQSTPALRVIGIEVHDEDADGAVEPGEVLDIDLDLRNHLAPIGPVEVELRSESPHVVVLAGTVSLAGVAPQTTVQLGGLAVRVAEDAPLHQPAVLRLEFRALDGSYVDSSGFEILLSPAFVTHESNPLRATVALARLGHSTQVPAFADDGAGFRYRRTADLVADAGLVVGVSAAQVSDVARPGGAAASTPEGDFVALAGGFPQWISRGNRGEWRSLARFDDSGASAPLGLEIEQESIQVEASPHEDTLILRYTLTNRSGTRIDGLRVGYACDWSIDRSSPLTNRISFDPKRRLGIAWDELGQGGGVHVGVTVASAPGATSFYGVDDAWTGENGQWGLYDGFSEEEKWQALSSGVVNPTVGPADVTMVVGTGPFDVEAGDAITVAFLFAAGDDLFDLYQNVEHGQRAWRSLARSAWPALVGKAHPNPVERGDVTWSFSGSSLAGSHVEAKIYDVRGRFVREIFRGLVTASTPDLSWDRTDRSGQPVAAGLYFLRLQAPDQVQSRRVLVVR